MTVDYAALLEEHGAEGFVEFIAESDELDFPPQYANLEAQLNAAYTAREAGTDDPDLIAFIDNAEMAILKAYEAEDLRENGNIFDFDIQEFFNNPMEAIQNFFGRIMETLQEGGIGALFNASANPQAIQAASQASLTAAARAAEALRDSEAQGADAVRSEGSTNAVTDAVRSFDGMIP